MPIRVLIVDDEPLARLGVSARLRACPDMVVAGECATGEEALRAVASLTPDTVFLDIEMPGISGLELVRLLPREQAPCIVFLTAHEEYAVRAFDVEALDYLLKPIDDTRFTACLERIRRVVAFRRQEGDGGPLGEHALSSGKETGGDPIKRFAVRRGHEVMFVQAAEVDWIEGLDDYAGLHVGSKTHLIRETLNGLEARLDRTQFLRIHRSTIVQVDRITRVEPLANRDALVTTRDGKTLRASRTYRTALQDLLRNIHPV